MKNRPLVNRRDFVRKSALALGALGMHPALLPRRGGAQARVVPTGEFLVGVNYPWAAYGHDFGKNAWGHDGIITGGWTYQTFEDSQGFTDARYCTDKAHTGVGSLCITATLVGHDPNRANGEVYIDLRNHPPPGVSFPLNLQGLTVTCWVSLPPGSAGNPSAPNGLQLFFKSEGFYSWYSQWSVSVPLVRSVGRSVPVAQLRRAGARQTLLHRRSPHGQHPVLHRAVSGRRPHAWLPRPARLELSRLRPILRLRPSRGRPSEGLRTAIHLMAPSLHLGPHA